MKSDKPFVNIAVPTPRVTCVSKKCATGSRADVLAQTMAAIMAKIIIKPLVASLLMRFSNHCFEKTLILTCSDVM